MYWAVLGRVNSYLSVYSVIFGMVTNKRTIKQPGDPSARLLLTSVRRQSFAKIIGVHFVTIHQPLWVCIEVWLQCPKEAHFIARNAQSKKAEGNLYVQTPTELEERDDLEEKLSSPSSSAAATCSWIRLRGQKHEMRGAGGRWRHSPSHDSFQPYPIINDLRRIFSIKPEIFRWKNIEKEHSVTCYPCNIRHLYTQPYSKSEKALNCR